MTIKIPSNASAYDALAGVLREWAFQHNRYNTLIVDIRTTVLGADRIIADTNSYGGYDFLDDWYEGGELELLGITPIDEIDEPKYRL